MKHQDISNTVKQIQQQLGVGYSVSGCRHPDNNDGIIIDVDVNNIVRIDVATSIVITDAGQISAKHFYWCRDKWECDAQVDDLTLDQAIAKARKYVDFDYRIRR